MVDDKFGEAFRAQLLSLFVWRRDVRRFSCNSLPEKLLERLAGIACLAPSVGPLRLNSNPMKNQHYMRD
jgi:5,6-dimethylbenzimidazole synthase